MATYNSASLWLAVMASSASPAASASGNFCRRSNDRMRSASAPIIEVAVLASVESINSNLKKRADNCPPLILLQPADAGCLRIKPSELIAKSQRQHSRPQRRFRLDELI